MCEGEDTFAHIDNAIKDQSHEKHWYFKDKAKKEAMAPFKKKPKGMVDTNRY